MRICFIISGIHRSYFNNLHKYLINLLEKNIHFDVYINFLKDDDKIYYNNISNYNNIKLFNFYKNIMYSDNINFNKKEKENNILNQWLRLYNLFNTIPDNYNLYIRIRPDIEILLHIEDFINLLNSINKNILSIPNGFDFHNSVNLSNDTSICINDQIAIGNYYNMNIYSKFYNYLIKKETVIESEKDLLKYLNMNNIIIERIILPYKIILSECKVVSIAGDSGSGKSTLIKSLEQLFLFDNYIVLETDRYHKWERGSDNWNSYTHLNPNANHLEKMSEDVFRLKLGENIFAVDYNHSTGKFTEKQKIEAKPYILLCGLHTLYKDNIRNLSEIKIFLDTEKELKREWKIQRDIIERNKSKDEIIQNIKKRENDYYKYIEPQKYHSDIIIQYTNNNGFIIHINDNLNYYTNTFLSQISSNNYKENNFNKYFINKDKIDTNIIKLFINNNTILDKLSEYPFNIIQTIIYLCLFKE